MALAFQTVARLVHAVGLVRAVQFGSPNFL
jgi:hypothetical protein